MGEIIKRALDSIKITNYYFTRGNNTGECCVYNYTSKPSYYADNVKKGEEYSILLNLYCINDLENNKKRVIDTMNLHGIKGGKAQKPFKEANGLYNIAIYFNAFMRE